MPHHGTQVENTENCYAAKDINASQSEASESTLVKAFIKLGIFRCSNKSDVLPRTAPFFWPVRLCCLAVGLFDRLHSETHNLRNSQHAIFPSGHSVRLNSENFGQPNLCKAQFLSFSFQRCAIHRTSHPTTFWGTKRSIRKVYGTLDATIH